MSNGEESGGSIWPAITVVLIVVVLGVAGWAAIINGKRKDLETKVSGLESRVVKMERSMRNAARQPVPATQPVTGKKKGSATTTTTAATTRSK